MRNWLLCILSSALVAVLATPAGAASIASSDWMQPQILVVKTNSLGRIQFEFCAKGDPQECRTLGPRQFGYDKSELAVLASRLRAQSDYLQWSVPLQTTLYTVASGTLIVTGTNIGIIAGGLLWNAADQVHQDPRNDSNVWRLMAKVTAPTMASPAANFSWDFDIRQFALELNKVLETLPSYRAECDCSVRGLTAQLNGLTVHVQGQGHESWQAHMNIQFRCQKSLAELTGRFLPAANLSLTQCQGQAL